MMNNRVQLPSYQEAIRNTVYAEGGQRVLADVIELAVQDVDPKDYCNLCLVSKGVHAVFAPLLSKNPLRMIRALGLRTDFGMSRCRPASSTRFSAR